MVYWLDQNQYFLKIPKRESLGPGTDGTDSSSTVHIWETQIPDKYIKCKSTI